MIYHLIERHRESGHARIVLSSNQRSVTSEMADARRGLIPDADFIVGQHPEWTPDPAQVAPLTKDPLLIG